MQVCNDWIHDQPEKHAEQDFKTPFRPANGPDGAFAEQWKLT